jgi:hypothetical protein
MTLLAPAEHFVYRPLAVLEPFTHRAPRLLALADVADELGASFERETLASVDVDRRRVRTGNGRELSYDALLIVAPKPTWPLPVYELALLMRKHARTSDVAKLIRDRAPDGDVELLRIIVATAERQPLEAFGDAVSNAGRELLAEVDIELSVDADASIVESHTSDTPTWTPEAKVAAQHLGPYLDERWAAGARWVAGQLSWEAVLAKLEQRFGQQAEQAPVR